MLKPFFINENKSFIGRKAEQHYLAEIIAKDEASIIVVYGRRRVGKTELLEQVFRHRNILKFEGVESGDEKLQQALILSTLAKYADDPKLGKLSFNNWVEILELLADYLKEGEWTLYFEELQWIASYQPHFISALKRVWDNYLRHNPKLIILLCGSSPSFMISEVLKSKALYNRSQYELHVKPFTLLETQAFLPQKSPHEIMDAYLSIGGIPEYLKRIKSGPSLYLGICKESFSPGGFFVHEYQRIFTSSLANNKYYKEIIEFLSHRKFATRDEIMTYLKISSGGSLSTLLEDLELCGFINKYTPYHSKPGSLLARYSIAEAYLQLYYKFIHEKITQIEQGDYQKNPSSAIAHSTYLKYLGFAFERYCQSQSRLIATLLGFSGVAYHSGPFFNRETSAQKSGFQLDLVFERQDRVITLCEIKYLNRPVDKTIIREFEQKLALFNLFIQNAKKTSYTLQKVLISAQGADESVINSGYFDRILVLEDLFK